MSTINSSHQGKSQMENVAVQKGTFLLKQHCQQLKENNPNACCQSSYICKYINIYVNIYTFTHTGKPYAEQFLRLLRYFLNPITLLLKYSLLHKPFPFKYILNCCHHIQFSTFSLYNILSKGFFL